MTDKQSEALRIADLLGKEIHRTVYVDVLHQNAINELRRLHIEVERLTECLRRANGLAEHFERHWYLRGDQIDELIEALNGVVDYTEWHNEAGYDAHQKALAVLRKAQGDNNGTN